jgi:MFS family permease
VADLHFWGGGPASSSPPPPVYYGWVLTSVLALTETISWGILYYSFAVMIPPMEAEFGWSRAETSGAFSLALLISGVSGVFVGRWLDRHGARALMSAGSIIAALLVFAWSRVGSLPQLYLIWALVGLAMAATLYEPAFAVVARWFDRRRRQALTLLTFVAGMASLIFVPFTQWLTLTHGWRMALMILALLLACVTIPMHLIFVRRSPQDLGLLPDGVPTPPAEAPHPALNISPRVALRNKAFWALVLALMFNTFASAVIGVHLLSYLLDKGFSPAFAATTAGLVGGMQLPGRVLFSAISSRLPRHVMTTAVFLMQLAAFLTLTQAQQSMGIFAFVALYGMSNGMATLLRASLVAELFGPAYYGSLNGVVGSVMAFARAAAPLAAGILYTRFHSYIPVLWTLALFSVLSVICASFAEAGSRNLQPTAAAPHR